LASLEYDFYGTLGAYTHEPAGSVQTLDVPADIDGITEILLHHRGVLSIWPPTAR
jgi:hypothetical protein